MLWFAKDELLNSIFCSGWATQACASCGRLEFAVRFHGSFLGALVLLYSIGYMAHDESATRFYCTMLVFIGGFIAWFIAPTCFLLRVLGSNRAMFV